MKKLTIRNLRHATRAALLAAKVSNPVIEADAALVQDRGLTRANFQGRFRKTAFGDFKGRSRRAPEVMLAQIEYLDRRETARRAAEDAAELVDAAAATGIVIEPEQSNG
jgi:hypothetical protein